jgi:hypothetical protein
VRSEKAEENIELLTEKRKSFPQPPSFSGGSPVALGDCLWPRVTLEVKVASGVLFGIKGSRVASGGHKWP